MNRFNLTFWGEILEGRDPRKVKARFAKMFSIEDPERLEHFFSGDTVILRRNLERKVAAEYYSKLRKLGVEVRLVKVEPISQDISVPPAAPDTPSDGGHAETDWEKARRLAELEAQQRRAQHAAEREQARKQEEAAAAQHRARQEALRREREEAESRRQREQEERRREQAEAEARHRAELEARRQQQAREAAERKAAR